MSKKRLLFSLTKKDFEVQTFRAGGKGGQHQNKTDSAVRIIHPASGAVGECREFRCQHRNKRVAFERLAASVKFKLWHAAKCAELMGLESPEQIVERQMAPENLKVEGRVSGKWVRLEDK